MSEQVGLTRGQNVTILIVVSVVAAVVAGFLGSLASLLYDWIPAPPYPKPLYIDFGMYWGAFTGIIAAIFWCRLMNRHICDKGDHRLLFSGSLAGIMAGVISTTLLHAGLIVVSQRAEWEAVLFCEACGVVAGLVVGVIAAGGVRAILRKTEQHSSDVCAGSGA